ncbi:MAG: Hpt domain-containing protein [Gammaproteobacteria bacterium]
MTDLSSEAKEKIDKLKKAYVGSFPEKTRELETLWQALQSNEYSEDNLIKLAASCHKLAGSSGSYEFSEISRAAHSVEMYCQNDFTSMDQKKAHIIELKHLYMRLVKLLGNTENLLGGA